MSWIQVDFSLVRYSPVENTHYFHDPAHPTAIQFLLNGQWESWDVGWVKHNTLILAKAMLSILKSSASPQTQKHSW
ncbi:hypothetical protein N0V90_001630 [Kalmusia sp. IMI 367209]|nr:hypothetical protein N0V90_001630 [Kalmusia sp. IMI 367209]